MENKKLFYWIFVIILFAISLIGGLFGFQKYFDLHAENYDIWRSLYRSIQLFTFENGDLEKPIPLALNIARFTSPITTLITIFLTFFGIFREQWKRFRISTMKNHIVVIGLGNKGMNIVKENLKKKEKILVIEKDPLNPNLTDVHHEGCLVLQEDATQLETLKKAQVFRAKTVFLLMGDDSSQVKSCMHIYRIIKQTARNEKNALTCNLHLANPAFLNTMRIHKLIPNTRDGLLLNIFNVYENSARDLFVNNPPDRSGIPVKSKNYVQIIIFGFGKAGQALALQTAFNGHYTNFHKPKVLVIDKKANKKIPVFLEQYPTYTDYCDLQHRTIEAKSPQLIRILMKFLEDPMALTTIVFCFDNKELNLILGLQLDNITTGDKMSDSKIFVRTNDNETLETFSSNIFPYGLHSRVCSGEVIAGGELDKKAKIIHLNYLNKRKKTSDFGSKESDVPWQNLSQEYKNSNRNVADHIGVKMRCISCEIVKENVDDLRPTAVFSPNELMLLSKLEHRRWTAERSLTGWYYGEQKNDKTRKTPYLTEWENLSKRIKDYDSEMVTIIPDVLKQIGMKIVQNKKHQK